MLDFSDFLHRAYGGLGLPVVVTDLAANIVYVNPAFTRLSGYALDEVLGRNPRILQSGDTDPAVYREMWHALTAGKDWHGQFVNKSKHGRRYVESIYISPLASAGGERSHYLGVWLDVTQDLAARDRVELAARTDQLTGVLNRRGLVERLDSELHRARRHGRPLSAMLVDLDGFKAVNDEHGHTVGDAVLRAVASAISRCVRHEDVVGRYGGDEFLVILPETGPRVARVVADRVVRAVGECGSTVTARTGARGVAVSCSVGVAGLDHGAEGIDEVVAQLDRQLFAAKSAGKNRAHGTDL